MQPLSFYHKRKETLGMYLERRVFKGCVRCCYTSHRQTLRHQEMQRESKRETQTMNVIPICLCHHPWDWANTQKSLKSNPLHRRVTAVIIQHHKSQKHNAAEISCTSSWAGPIKSHRGRRWSSARCFPKDKRYINKQQHRKRKPTLPSCYLTAPPQ